MDAPAPEALPVSVPVSASLSRYLSVLLVAELKVISANFLD
jgi:hypothetical protein